MRPPALHPSPYGTQGPDPETCLTKGLWRGVSGVLVLAEGTGSGLGHLGKPGVGDTCTWWQVEAVTSAQRLRRPEESRKTTGKAWWKSARAGWEGEREASQGWALTSGCLAQTQHCPTHQGGI